MLIYDFYAQSAAGEWRQLYSEQYSKKGKGSPYSITVRRVPELIPVLGSQPAGYVSHKPGGRLPLLSSRPAVTPATLKRAATSFAAWWTEARWVWTVCLRLFPDSVAAAIWTQALLRLSPALTTRLPSHPTVWQYSMTVLRSHTCILQALRNLGVAGECTL